MVLTANGQDFGQFTANGLHLSIAVTRIFVRLPFWQLTVKIYQFLPPTASAFKIVLYEFGVGICTSSTEDNWYQILWFEIGPAKTDQMQ